MRILEFKARGVFGYLNISIQFDRNPLIVIAPNGSGKTTALRLMQALITPDLRDLLTTEFQEAVVRLNDNAGSDRVIAARRTKSTLVLSISDRDGELIIPIELLAAVEAELPAHQRQGETSRALRLKYADNEIFRALSEISMPVFLGLDRRSSAIEDSHAAHPDSFYRYSHRRNIGSRYASNSLSTSLRESQELIQNAYRKARKIQDYRADRLRRQLLLTGFEYIEFDLKNPATLGFDYKSLTIADLEQQRRELLSALQSVGIESQEAEKELNPFFEKVRRLLSRLHSKRDDQAEGEAVFEAMLNRASLARLKRSVDAVREFNEDHAGINQKIRRFVGCLNHFFADSRKEVHVDGVGILKFSMPHKIEEPVEALSSGEQQLVIMFSHLFFSAFGDKSSVFVIDEPELSLHLRWQESLLDKMIESSPRAQIIVATHSPEIVGDRIENCTGIHP